MQESEYSKYLESQHWLDTRVRILDRDGHRCLICSGRAIQVHHVNYRNWYDVQDTDLMSVCKKCHRLIHLAIDAGNIPPYNQSTISLTQAGLLKYLGKTVSTKKHKHKKKRKNVYKSFVINKQLCNELESICRQAQQLVCGVLRIPMPHSFYSIEGMMVGSKNWQRFIDAKNFKSNSYQRPQQKPKPRGSQHIARPVNFTPPWVLELEIRIKSGRKVSESEMSSYKDYQRFLDRKNKSSNLSTT